MSSNCVQLIWGMVKVDMWIFVCETCHGKSEREGERVDGDNITGCMQEMRGMCM